MCRKLSLPCGEGMRWQNSEEVPACRQRLGHWWGEGDGAEQRNDCPPGCTQGEVCVGPRGCVQGGVRVGVQFRASAYVSLESSLRDNILSRP